MKTKLFTLVLAVAVSVVSFTACSKNADKPANGGNSTKDKLVGSYKMTQLTVVREGSTTDILAQYKPCDKDNVYVLKSNMTSAVVDAGEQCSPSSDDSGTWSLPNDNTIVMEGQAYHIDSMDGTTLKMSVEFQQQGAQATLKMTYVKQ